MVKKDPRVIPAASPDAPAAAPTAVPALDDAGASVQPGAWPEATTEPAGPHCPWCSAALASADLATCPACGAQLSGTADDDLPGVTTIDVKALAWKAGAPPRRNKLMSWISGEADDAPASAAGSASAIEPPTLAVRREMLRLELEAGGFTLPPDPEPDPEPPADQADAPAEAAPTEVAPGASESESGPPGA